MNLFLLDEIITNNFHYNFLNLISLVSVLCGILVITSKNPIVSVLFLIGLFITIAGYLMMLGMNFIGLSYLLVYVGAVSILFIFILMLINVRISELVTDNSNSIILAIMISVFVTMNQLFPTATGRPVMVARDTDPTGEHFRDSKDVDNPYMDFHINYTKAGQDSNGLLSATSHS